MKKIGIVLLSLCLLLCSGGCGREQKTYRKAERQMASASYAGAADLFSSLGDYRDAAEKTRECKYRLAKTLAQPDAPDYAEAVRLLDEIGAYKDAIALKNTLRETYFFPEHGYRIPCLECVAADAHRTSDSGKDEIGAFRRYTYTWPVSDDADAQTLTAQFVQWLSYVDGVDGLDTEPYRNGAFFLCVDGDPLGVVSSQKTGVSVSITVILYEEPLER